MLGIDYAGGRPGGAAIKTAGYGFVCRYLTDGGPGLPGKLLTPVEYRDLQSSGISIVVNFETTADRMLAGFDAGVQDASGADTVVRALGHPSDRPIYFSADFDATPAQQAEIDDYLRGCASVIGASRVGVYGGYWVVKRCLDNHTARWAWQTGAWSGGNIDPRIHIYQRIGYVTVGGIQCDVNEARQADFGQHPHPGADMTPDEHNMLAQLHDALLNLQTSRVPDSTYQETSPGYLLNVDSVTWRTGQALDLQPGGDTLWYSATLSKLAAEIEALSSQVSALKADITTTIQQAIASGVVEVDVTVANKTKA